MGKDRGDTALHGEQGTAKCDDDVAELDEVVPFYNKIVEAHPLLSRHEENVFVAQIRKDKNLLALECLCNHTTYLVLRLVKPYERSWCPQAILIKAGRCGLMRAVRRFDPDTHVRLEVFAKAFINQSIKEELLASCLAISTATLHSLRATGREKVIRKKLRELIEEKSVIYNTLKASQRVADRDIDVLLLYTGLFNTHGPTTLQKIATIYQMKLQSVYCILEKMCKLLKKTFPTISSLKDIKMLSRKAHFLREALAPLP